MEKLIDLSLKYQKLLITDPDSIYYFTGCSTPGASFAALIVNKSQITLVVRDLEMSNYTKSGINIIPYSEQTPVDIVANVLKQECIIGGHKVEVGFDGDSSRFSAADSQLLFKLLTFIKFTDVSKELKYMRVKKSNIEIDYITKAASYVKNAYIIALNNIKIGMTETELSGWLNYGKMYSGSEWTAYPEFVSFGVNGCIGHHAASSDTKLKTGELVFMEIGASHKRYHAAMMHCFWTGVPPVWFNRLKNCIKCAISVAKSICVPGTRASDVDKVMRNIIEHAFDNCDIHFHPKFTILQRSGYSIGIGNATDWADKIVRITPTSNDIIEENMVLHLIPWLQIDDIGAMGFSDTVVVKNYGLQSLFDEYYNQPLMQ